MNFSWSFSTKEVANDEWHCTRTGECQAVCAVRGIDLAMSFSRRVGWVLTTGSATVRITIAKCQRYLFFCSWKQWFLFVLFHTFLSSYLISAPKVLQSGPQADSAFTTVTQWGNVSYPVRCGYGHDWKVDQLMAPRLLICSRFREASQENHTHEQNQSSHHLSNDPKTTSYRDFVFWTKITLLCDFRGTELPEFWTKRIDGGKLVACV